MYRVYKITNIINDKVYIGQTLRTLKARLNAHKNANTIIGRAIRELGIQNFTIEEVCSSEDKNDILKLEQEYIKKYNSEYPNGYNASRNSSNYSNKTEWGITFSVEFIKSDLADNKFSHYLIRLLKYIKQDFYIYCDFSTVKRWGHINELCGIVANGHKTLFKKWCTDNEIIKKNENGLYVNSLFFKLIYAEEN